MIADRFANSVAHEPTFRALSANVSIPGSASSIFFSQDAAVVNYSVALVARKADSFGPIELAAERRSLAADSVLVEVVPLGAFCTQILDPCLAAIIIGDGDDVVKRYSGRSRIITTEVS